VHLVLSYFRVGHRRWLAIPAHLTLDGILSVLYGVCKTALWLLNGHLVLLFGFMARPYGDPVEIVTAPIPAQSPFIPTDAKIVVGAVAPASPDPIPIVLLPGFEYRMLEWRHPTTHEIHWRLERRKSAQHGEDDE